MALNLRASRFGSAFFLWLLAVFLSMWTDQKLYQVSASVPAEFVDPLSRFVGSAKEAFGDSLFLKADAYFHGGLTHERHHDDSAESLDKEGVFHEAKELSEQAPRDWIEKINHEIGAHELMHLSQKNRKEMLPFFAMSTTLDPHNIEAVLTTAYWLEREFSKPEDATELLEKSIHDNPYSWEIESALGRLYFRQKKEWLLAEQHLRQALQKLGSGKIENFERVDIYYHLGQTRLVLGKKLEALEAYRQARRFFDEKTTPFLQALILGKIKELQTLE